MSREIHAERANRDAAGVYSLVWSWMVAVPGDVCPVPPRSIGLACSLCFAQLGNVEVARWSDGPTYLREERVMAKRFIAGGRPQFRTADRVTAGWKSHTWRTADGEVHPVVVRKVRVR